MTSRPKTLKSIIVASLYIGFGMVVISKVLGFAFGYDMVVRSMLLGSNKELSGSLKINILN